MKNKSLLIAIAVMLTALVSCKNKADLLIPKDAAVVVRINGTSLTSKLSWNEIKQTNWFKDVSKEADSDSLTQKILENPDASGINIKSDFLFFMKKQGNGGYNSFQGKIKDASAFEAFIKKLTSKKQIEKQGEWNYVEQGSQGLVFWNDQKFAFIDDMPDLATNASYPYGERQSFSIDSLKKFMTENLSLKGSNNLTEDKRFASLMAQDGDVQLWLNSGQMYSGLGGITSMMKMNAFIEGNAAAMNLIFDDGKITIDTKQYYGKAMQEVLKKYPMKPVSASAINRLPSQNVAGAFVMNYPPELLKSSLEQMGFDGMLNAVLGNLNTNLGEFVAAYKGEMVFAVTDFELKKEEYATEAAESYSAKPSGQMLFALSVKDKTVFEKLINIATEQLKNAGNEAVLSKVNYKMANDWFAISNSAEKVDQFLTSTNNKAPYADKISGHPFGLYIDAQKILKSVQPAISSSVEQIPFEASMKLWEDVIMTGGEMEGDASVANIVINLIDKKTNSLKQFNQAIEQVAAANKKMRTEIKDVELEDMHKPQEESGTVAPPAVDVAIPAEESRKRK